MNYYFGKKNENSINLSKYLGGKDEFQRRFYLSIIYKRFPLFKEIIEYKKPIVKFSIDLEYIKKILRRQLKSKRIELKDLELERNKLFLDSINCEKKDDWLYKMIIEDIDNDILKIKSKIKSLKFKINYSTNDNKNSDFDIDSIKRVPIYSVMPDGHPDKKQYLCPFHNEKTPSFFIYKKDDIEYAKCFGCGFQGSVIDVYMKLNDCDFVTACKKLSIC